MGDGPGFACHRQLEILGDILMPPTDKNGSDKRMSANTELIAVQPLSLNSPTEDEAVLSLRTLMRLRTT